MNEPNKFTWLGRNTKQGRYLEIHMCKVGFARFSRDNTNAVAGLVAFSKFKLLLTSNEAVHLQNTQELMRHVKHNV